MKFYFHKTFQRQKEHFGDNTRYIKWCVIYIYISRLACRHINTAFHPFFSLKNKFDNKKVNVIIV